MLLCRGLGLVLCLLLLSLHSVEGALKVLIDQNIGGTECRENSNTTVSCPSLNQLVREFANYSNVAVHVFGEVNVSSLVVFHNISNLSIVGLTNNSELPLLKCRHIPHCGNDECAGLQFVRIQTLRIANVVIFDCGGKHSFRHTILLQSAVYINECSDVTIKDVDIIKSNRTSLFIHNTSGNVYLESIHIRENLCSCFDQYIIRPKESFAGGVQVFFLRSTHRSQYKIINCLFSDITTPNYTEYNPSIEDDVTEWIGYGLGGGLSVIFDKNSSQHSVLVDSCEFSRNRAPWGAGMYIKFLEASSQNEVTVNNSIFQNCTDVLAGGGIGIEVLDTQQLLDVNNSILISNSIFRHNTAVYGAGIYIFASYYRTQPASNKHIVLTNCSWEKNWAQYSPAVYISPLTFYHLKTGLLPIPVFEDCNFIGNQIIFSSSNNSASINVGVFVISRFIVTFKGTIYFDNNAYTALLLISGQVIIEPNSRLTFTNNKGLRGGAISMHSFSSIEVSDNCTLEFFNNTATEYGGAIYQYSTEVREILDGRTCFLAYHGQRNTSVSKRNINFVFAGNKAPISGSSIFASSFRACYFSNRGRLEGHDIKEFLDDIGNYSFDSMNRTSEYIAPALGTSGSTVIDENENNTLFSIPGMRLFLPLYVEDELKQILPTEFVAQIAQSQHYSDITINGLYTVNDSLIIYGPPNKSVDLITMCTAQHAYQSIQYTSVVKLLPCPPGYYFDGSKRSCKCSAEVSEHAFKGIPRCNSQNFTAIFKSGYWVGYYQNTLYTALCPYEFCIRMGQDYSLPNSSTALSTFICRSGRKGVLCGQCDEGQSMYYHSIRLRCGDNYTCPFGILLYIVSELIPVLIFFTLVVTIDISFTSGARNGFIFFSQIVTILPHDFGKYNFESLHYLQSGYNQIYRIFSLDYFSMETLSFCLFKGATVMDVLAFKYITVLFAFILVIAVVVWIKYCRCCSKCGRSLTVRASVLHGLSAFIVICYSESVQRSFFILRHTKLQGAGRKSGPSVAHYAGVDYLKENHLPYAIPAIMCLATIGILPPFLLLIFPSILKLLEFCKLSEHRLVTFTLRVTRINSLMPMFNVFQGCFKDNFRFFSGLYFFYRVAILAPCAFSMSLYSYTLYIEFALIIMLGAHSVFQPYNIAAHNFIDSLLFVDLGLINGCTLLLLNNDDSFWYLPQILYTQMVLIYAPIIVVLIIYVAKLIRAVHKRFSKKVEDESEQEFLEQLDNIDRDVSDSVDEVHLHGDYKEYSY